MSQRPPLLVGVVVIVVALAVLAGAQVVTAQLGQGPEQPIGFTHLTHAGTLQIDCTFCHRNVTKGSNASIPPVQQCMFCHSVVTTGERPEAPVEIAKLREAFQNQQPIDWIRVHRVPDTVRFVHEAHVRGLSALNPGAPVVNLCATCHGNVTTMTKVKQVRPLKMGDCVACHRQNNAPTDCTTCHK